MDASLNTCCSAARWKTETKGVGASMNAFALLGGEEEDHDDNGGQDEDGDLSMAGVSVV